MLRLRTWFQARPIGSSTISGVRRRLRQFAIFLAILDVISAALWVVSTAEKSGLASGTFIVAVSAAAAGSGVILGFLFGLPRILSSNDRLEPSAGRNERIPGLQLLDDARSTRRYYGNSNLEQISDWLTKIIIGVGLVQLAHVPGGVGRFTHSLSGSLGPGGAQFCTALAIANLIGGFFIAYSWTRMPFLTELEGAERDLDEDALERARKVFAANALVDEVQHGTVLVPISNERVAMARAQSAIDPLRPSREVPVSGNGSDPWKGQFGGSRAVGSARLDAVLTRAPDSDLFIATLMVVAPMNFYTGPVTFFLHPRFANMTPTVDLVNGYARLSIRTPGTFTVGAVVRGIEDTTLELDMSEIEPRPAGLASLQLSRE